MKVHVSVDLTSSVQRAPRGRPHPLLQVFLLTSLAGVAWAGWNEIEPRVTFRPTAATVLSVALEQRSAARAGARTPRRSGFVPAVTYRYEVAGVSYVGSTWARTNTVESSTAARRRVKALAPGSTVTAWYKPNQPSEAVLSRAINPIWATILLAIAIFLALASRLTASVRVRRTVSASTVTPTAPELPAATELPTSTPIE